MPAAGGVSGNSPTGWGSFSWQRFPLRFVLPRVGGTYANEHQLTARQQSCAPFEGVSLCQTDASENTPYLKHWIRRSSQNSALR